MIRLNSSYRGNNMKVLVVVAIIFILHEEYKSCTELNCCQRYSKLNKYLYKSLFRSLLNFLFFFSSIFTFSVRYGSINWLVFSFCFIYISPLPLLPPTTMHLQKQITIVSVVHRLTTQLKKNHNPVYVWFLFHSGSASVAPIVPPSSGATGAATAGAGVGSCPPRRGSAGKEPPQARIKKWENDTCEW